MRIIISLGLVALVLLSLAVLSLDWRTKTPGHQPNWAWWNSSWANGKPFNLTERSGVQRVGYPVYYNFTGLTFSSTNELRIVNQSCNGGGGSEYPYGVVSSSAAGGWAALTILADAKASATTQYCIYYNNPGVAAPTYDWPLVFWWDFEENPPGDKSGLGHADGRVAGAAYTSTGGFDRTGAFQFSGGSYVSTSSSEAMNFNNGGFTIEYWANSNSDSKCGNSGYHQHAVDRWYFDSGDWYTLRYGNLQGDDDIRFGNNLGIYDTLSNPWEVNLWHHLMFMRSGDTEYTYVNATQYSSAVMSGTLRYTPSLNLTVGAVYNWPNDCFIGVIDEVRLWNNSMNSNQRASLAAPSKLQVTAGQREKRPV